MNRMMRIFFTIIIVNVLLGTPGVQIQYSVEGKNYEGYYTDGGRFKPLILLVHDWDGLNSYELKRSEMLNKLGYSVFAVDLYGTGVRPVTIEEKRKFSGDLYNDRQKMRTLLNAAITEADRLGADTKNSVAVGYCFGGSAIMELARSGTDMKAFVSFHGGLEIPEGQNYNNVKGEILVFHGSADKAVPFERFTQLASDLESAGIKHEMITYSGADHAFSVFGSSRYHPEADKKSWSRLVEYLDDLFTKEVNPNR